MNTQRNVAPLQSRRGAASQQPLQVSRFRDILLRNDTSEQKLKSSAFKDGLNLVTDPGDNDLRLIEAMFGNETNWVLTIQGPEFRSLPRAFLVAGHEGIPDLRGAVLKYSGKKGMAALDLDAIAVSITANLTMLMRRKIEYRLSKFSYLLGKGSPFRVELDRNLRVSIFDAVSGHDIGVGFEAHSERWAVYMATALALRRHLFPDWDFPFVMCGIPSGDQSIRRSLFEFAPAMSGQVIVLSFAGLYQEMRIRPHWQLRLDEHSRAIRLTKARGHGLAVRR
jgi:hypothetical protein